MIYLHIPFCHRKCTYCAFYSAVTGSDKQDYVEALCSELRRRCHEQEHPIRTIYFGGGTPTLLTLSQLQTITEALRTHYDTSQLEEVTIEANPEDLTPAYLHGLRNMHFFNRISIGVQSFRDSDLRLLNRRHDAQQALTAVQNASNAGFDNISIDLIYGLPNQTLADWQQNLRQLDPLPISHLSAYALTIEEGTMLYHQVQEGKVTPADEETVIAQYEALTAWANSHGFNQYEISNFCKPGQQAVHNSRYWNRTPYLGVGAAAHSFDGQRRRWNVADIKRYVSSANHGPIDHEEEELGLKEAHNEYLMTALRTTAGIDKRLVASPFAKRLAQEIQKFVSQGLLTETATHYQPTQQGLLHADGIAAELFVV